MCDVPSTRAGIPVISFTAIMLLVDSENFRAIVDSFQSTMSYDSFMGPNIPKSQGGGVIAAVDVFCGAAGLSYDLRKAA
jgi:hypothetical protein